MEDIFKPQSLAIKQLFGNADALYQIPRYQRPYSWVDDQLEKLWEDLREAQFSDQDYFLGSIITAKPEEKSNYLDIVDGQQRLTTLLILLCVCRDLYPDINREAIETDPFAIDANVIKTSIKFNDRFERLRLKTHSNHESDFQDFVLAEGNSILHTAPLKRDLKKEEDPKYKFRNTAFFFTIRLKEIGCDETGELINYLFNKVKIIRIDCQSVSFAIKLFQVLNARGLDLSNSDLLKSYFIGNIHKMYDTDRELKRQKEDQFMDDWKTCENIALDTEESLNELFVMYEYYLLGDNPEKSLYDELTILFKGKNPNLVIADFRNFIKRYRDRVYLSDDPVMFSFWYIKWSMYWRTIVLTALHTNFPEFKEFLKVLRRYYYLNWIAGNTLTKIKQTSFNIIKWLKENQTLAFIRRELDRLLLDSSNSILVRAVDALNLDIYYDPWCKPVLFLIEYNQQDNPKFLPIGDKSIHTEHIIPEAYEKNKDWRHIESIEGIDEWINSAANLTLLSGAKNIAASNNGFDDKIKAYDGRGHYEEDDNKITSFNITQNIVNDYWAKKFNGEWDREAINDRWKWFCEQIGEILEIDMASVKSNQL